jgi:hypothetical protein
MRKRSKMSHYLVHYSYGANNAYDYPKSIADVVWKLVVYHYTDQVMVGETDAVVKADGKQVITLTPDEANKLIEEYQSSYPKLQNLPDPLRLPPKTTFGTSRAASGGARKGASRKRR